MKEQYINIMLSYARSGGTLLNRCLGVLSNVVMLSEINAEALCPNTCNTIDLQAKKWYNIDVKKHEFIKAIREVYDYCSSNGKVLIIRDWSFGSFVPSRYNNFKPSKTLYSLILLSKYFPVRVFAFVRDPIDVWLSMYYSKRTFYDIHLNYLFEFINQLYEFNIKVFYYEDFCRRPKQEMEKICKYCGLEFDPEFLDRYKYNFNVCGDTDSKIPSRGISQDKIKLLPRMKVPVNLIENIENNTKKNEIIDLLHKIKLAN